MEEKRIGGRNVSIPLKRLDCFDVMREDLEAARGDGANALLVAAEVGHKALDEEVGPGALHGPHGGREVPGALVHQVVPVHRREYDVVYAPTGHRTRRALRLLGVHRRRSAMSLY